MHFRVYRIAIVYITAMVVGSALNLWYVWVSAFINNESTVTFTTNEFHEQLPEFIMLTLFVFAVGWLWIRRDTLYRFLLWKYREEL